MPGNDHHESVRGALVTIIAFAESGQRALERVVNLLVIKAWTIKEIKIIQVLSDEKISQLEQTMKRIYQESERAGIGLHIDTW